MLLKGRYEVLETLGTTTRLARRLRTEERLVVKEIVVRDLASWTPLQQMEEETRVLSGVEHPAVPAFVDAFVLDEETPDPRCFLVRQWIDGVPLVEAARRRMSADELRGTARALLSALGSLHALSPPLIHGDLDLEKVFRRPDGSLAFVGFGRAGRARLEAEARSPAAPEREHEPATVASDLYSVGAMLHRLAGGPEAPPLAFDRRGRPRLDGGLPGDLRRLLDRLLRVDPRERPASAEEALGLLGDGTTTALARPEPTALATPRARWGRTTAVASLGALLELVLLFASPSAAALALPPLLVALYLSYRGERASAAGDD